MAHPEPDPSRAGQHVDPDPSPLVAARERERRLADAQRLAHVGSWAWDLVSGVVTWSDELYRVLDLDPDVITPDHEAFVDRLHPAHRAQAEAVEQAALVDGRSCIYECPITLADGGERWIRALCAADADASGRPVRMHGTVQDVTELRTLEVAGAAAGRRDAGLHDDLTGLANRQLFAGRATAALDRAARRGRWSTALLVIDMDRFHQVNERFSYEIGNRVLAEVARRLGTGFRPRDTIGRLGGHTVARLEGDKFMILCESLRDSEVAPALCLRVAELMQSPVALDAREVLVTASIGISLASPGETDIAKLIVQAEAAVRLAKEQGGGAHVVFGDEMLAADTIRDEIECALRRALAQDEFRLHYQPKVALDTERIVGAEALLRWQHPQRGLVAPLDFIPLAEETGLIVPIGTWVIGEACREAARWRRVFPDRPLLQVSVNVSARQFGPGLVDVVTSALSTSGAEPGALCLEVTESVLMDDVGEAVTILGKVAGLGVALSIDDFGTGYSSLAHLKHLPLHELKIDKSFVDGLGRDASDISIVAALIAMAQALGLSVVAEGVETAEQVDRLRTLGCEQAQGYFFARPGTPEEIHDLLQLGEAWRREEGPEPRSEGALPNRRPERILVVDDEEEIRQLARMSLTAVGFEVHEATDGRSALASARRVAPRCVLLDLVLPDIGGAELCRALRAAPATARSTLVMLSSSDGAADKVEAFSSGADDYITKPFSPRSLAGRVNAAMRRRREPAGPGVQAANDSDGASNGAPPPAGAPPQSPE